LSYSQVFAGFTFTDFRYISFTEKSLVVFRFCLLPMTDVDRSTGLAGFNNRLHSDRFSAAWRLQTGA
jgi:hypothetical protein